MSPYAIPVFFNIMVFVVVLATLFITSNALAIFGLYFCQFFQMSYQEQPDEGQSEEDTEEKPMGFTATLK